jgi:SAM-dependent methyltransferase
MAEVRRVLRPGGRAVFSTWEEAERLADLAALFEAAGLLVVRVEEKPDWLARERSSSRHWLTRRVTPLTPRCRDLPRKLS